MLLDIDIILKDSENTRLENIKRRCILSIINFRVLFLILNFFIIQIDWFLISII